jgi:hypothetical protein
MAVAPKCFPAKRSQFPRKGNAGALAGVQTTIKKKDPRAKKGSPEASMGSRVSALAPSTGDWNPQALDALFGIVQDATADPKTRRTAARKIAECLLPKAGKKVKALPDDFGFTINPNLASRYRDIELEVRALMNDPTSRLIPANAKKLQKLQTGSEAIRGRLQVPCPTRYGPKEALEDYRRLLNFYRLRDNKVSLTEVQDAEEAHVKARFDVYAGGPEAVARRRCQALEAAERWSRLSRKDQNDLRLLRWLYPKPESDQSQIRIEDDEVTFCHHPFYFEQPASDGNFYPRDSKLRLARIADDPLVKAVAAPPISPDGPSNTPATARIEDLIDQLINSNQGPYLRADATRKTTP